MRSFVILSASAFLVKTLGALVNPTYHSLMWKFNDGNFWAPLGLNATTYALESTSGAAPNALDKRCDGGCSSAQYLPCTVVTIDGTLTAEALNVGLDTYRALGDDVWSEAQVRS